MSAPSALLLAPPRLVTTGHNQAGHSIIQSDQSMQLFQPFGPQGSAFARFHSRLSVPVDNTTDPRADLASVLPRCPPNGVLFCTTDIPPGWDVPMHRTISCDYIVVVEGEIVLKLDSGAETVVKAGEFIVQRGTNHKWINRSGLNCRLLVTMVGSEKIVLHNGTALEETVFKRSNEEQPPPVE